VNSDINEVLADIKKKKRDSIPEHDLLVGGFPCQDYSVAKPRRQARGIDGRKGVLWWAIHKVLEDSRPPLVFLENVDRLLRSPSDHPGRDFAVMLSCLSRLGYLVEWRVVDAAKYGFPQKRRRALIVARLPRGGSVDWTGPASWIHEDGVLARALAALPADDELGRLDDPTFVLARDPRDIARQFGERTETSPFQNAGVMWHGEVWSRRVEPAGEEKQGALLDVLVDEREVPDSFFIARREITRWKELKGAKRLERIAKTGHRYVFSEGALRFPDPVEEPARTILTGEGGRTPSRFKHVIRTESGRLRRLTPVELERLNGFEDDWTNTGMSDGRRAFMMGNAIIVGLVERVGQVLAADLSRLV
jgi:DNA (cytosine-5)-methyltransferase 1